MTEEEARVFAKVVERAARRHGLAVTHPYGDEYFEMVDGRGEVAAKLNPKDYTIEWCVSRLSDQLREYQEARHDSQA